MAGAPTRDDVDESLRDAADRFVGDLLDAGADERAVRLATLAVDDPRLFAVVRTLTAHLDDVDAFLETPLRAAAHADPVADTFVGRHFGHWRVARAIGRGGMGLVFEVERDDGVVEQRAALKLIKRSDDDASIAARFRTERQILAGLTHPDIARLIDAGATDDGRPYLVMEYIDGIPLDAWCDREALTVEQRIVLFDRVCDTVHYAHQRLVVHRDLKPNNILVTADGTPKLLDFGISKLIGTDSGAAAQTVDASNLLTPRYASPEQLTGAPISTASDVYSLGVLLFELLTGDTPYGARNDSLIAMMRAVVTDEPSRASAAVTSRVAAADARAPDDPDRRQRLAKRLRGDLDHILMKALAKDPADRYESAAALRDDLVRHLAGDPIRARPPTWSYRADRFVRKHAGAVATAAVVALAIVTLGLFAAREAWRADRAREQAEAQRVVAERRFEETRSLAKTMLFELNDAIATGPTKAREQLVRTALAYLDRLSNDRLTPDLQRDVAAGYERISEILGNQGVENLGRASEAKQYLEKALALRRGLAESDPRNPDNLAGLRSVYNKLTDMARYDNDAELAARYLASATEAAMKLVALNPDDEKSQLILLRSRRNEALILFNPGRASLYRFDDAKARYVGLVDEVERFVQAHPASNAGRDLLHVVLEELYNLQRLEGDAAASLVSARRSVAVLEAMDRDQPHNPSIERDLGKARRNVGDALLETGDTTAGLAMLQRAFDQRKALFDLDPSNARADRDLAIGHSMMGYAFEFAGRPADALDQYRHWHERATEALKREPTNVGHRLDRAQALWSMADMHLVLHDPALALAEARQVIADTIEFEGPMPKDVEAREALGKARIIAARSLATRGPSAEAFALAKEGLPPLAANASLVAQDAFAARDLARAKVQAGELGDALGGDARVDGCRLVVEGRDELQALQDRQRLSAQFGPILKDAVAAAARCARAR